MRYPTDLKPLALTRQMTRRFGGYDATLHCPENCFSEMENLSSDHYPLVSPRKTRSCYAEGAGEMIGKDALCYVEGSRFLINRHPVAGLTLATGCDSCHRRSRCSRYAPGKEQCPKTLVGMGAWVIILPDKLRVNTENGSFEELEAYFEAEALRFLPCTLTGAELPYFLSPTPPEDKALAWIDSGETPYGLKQWSSASESWVAVAATYVRLEAPGIGSRFSQGDTVLLRGIREEALQPLEGWQHIWAKGEDYLVVTGLCPGAFTQAVSISRTMPDMDFVIESKNRLWGCKYGIAEGQAVNEIYGSKLGDPSNWHCFQGISTDSQMISCGTDGPWTGAFSLDTPLFFKEDCLHRIYGDSAPFGLQIIPCNGVEVGSEKSLAVVGQTLFYKSPLGIMAYDGALPTEVSQALGAERYRQGVGGALGNKYYISMKDSRGAAHLFVYDAARRLWHREDGLEVAEFCSCGGQLFLRAQGKLLIAEGGGEAADWMAVTGAMGLEDPDGKYLLRLNLGLEMPPGSRLRVFLRYDGQDIWEPAGEITGRREACVELPIRPRRCQNLRLKLTGEGGAKLRSLTKTLAWGGDAL